MNKGLKEINFFKHFYDLVNMGFWKWRERKNQTVRKAREKFYKAVEIVNRGEFDCNAPIPGVIGELAGNSKNCMFEINHERSLRDSRSAEERKS